MMVIVNSNHEKAEVTTPISGKINFETKKYILDNEGCYIMIKNSIHQEGGNLYTPNNGTKIHEAKTDRKEERNKQFNKNS